MFGAHENENATTRFGTPGVAMFEARDGKIIWSALRGIDVERAVAADIDPRFPGYEAWSNRIGLHTWQGQSLGAAPRSNAHTIWWDGDLLRELLDQTTISKWDWNTSTTSTLLTSDEVASNNGTKANPALSADAWPPFSL